MSIKKEDITNVMPLNNYIICKLESEATKAGIILSDEAKESSSKWVAVKVGPEAKWVKEGDELIINPFNFYNNRVKIDDEHTLCSEESVIAVKRPK